MEKIKKRNDIILIAVLLLLTAAGLLLFNAFKVGGDTVVVLIDGKESASYPLSVDKEVVIETENGKNVLVIKDKIAFVKEAEQKGVRVAVLCAEETKENYQCKHIYSLGSLKQEKEMGAHLFATLRSFDKDGMEVIYSESFEQTKLAKAIMNRLRKAAGYQTITCE